MTSGPNKPRTFKLILLLAGVVLTAGIGLRLFQSQQSPGASGEPGDRPSTKPPKKLAVPRPPPFPRRIAALAEPAPQPAPASNMQQMLRGEAGPPKLSRQDVEGHLAQNGRTAGSLLAAFHASEDAAYLKEAAASFPNDPRIQLAVLMNNTFPEDRRQWLERFKASAPGNSLASYLSAHEYFQSGQFEAGISELLAASNRPGFEPYTFEGMLDMQDLLMAAGKSPTEAKVSAMLGATFPHLAQMRQLSSEMTEMQSQYRTAGDAASFEAITAMGLTLAHRLSGPQGGKCIIDQLVGIAIESQFLKPLDPASAPEFVGKPVQIRLEELAQQKVDMKKLAPLASGYLPGASEAELISYFDRVKLQGEMEALRWLQTKLGGQ